MIGIKDQYFGTEIEMTGITRQRAAEVVAEMFGTEAYYDGTTYGVWSVIDLEGKKWKFMSDGSIYTQRKVYGRIVDAGGEYSTEMVSPKLSYDEMGKLQEVVRCLRQHGGFVNESCGQHVHVDASNHTPQSLKNALTIMYAKEDILFKALKVQERRANSYCQRVRPEVLEKIRKIPNKSITMDRVRNVWYGGRDGSHTHYDHTRYYALNLHAVFSKGTLDIRESVQESYSWSQFLKEMEKRGYTWKLNRKYISLKAPGMERYIRLRSLGKNYSEEEIRGQILQPKVKRVYQKAVQIHPKKKLTGIQALYYSYLYQMGVLPKRPKRSPYAVREDIRKLDRRIEQIEFLMKHDIITREQLAAYREPLQKQIAELMKERRRLYRNGGRETGEERLSEINEELKRLRKEVRMTVQIEKHSLEIEAKLQKAEEQSQNEKRVEDKERMQKSQEVR